MRVKKVRVRLGTAQSKLKDLNEFVKCWGGKRTRLFVESINGGTRFISMDESLQGLGRVF